MADGPFGGACGGYARFSLESILAFLLLSSESQSDDDPIFEKRRLRFNELDLQLRQLATSLESIAKHQHDRLEAATTFWLAVSSSASIPDPVSPILPALARLGATQTKVHIGARG